MGPRKKYCAGLEFSFGPDDSFFVNSKKYWSWSNNLPKKLRDTIVGASEVYNCLLFEDDNYYVQWKDKSSDKCYGYTSLDTKSSSFAYGYKHLREAPTGNTIVTGNPDLGYFGLSAGTGTKNWKCGRAPENVWKYICDKKHYSWNHKKTPTFVTLGINGSYYLAFEGGAGCYAYDKHYPTLAGILARESSAKGGGAKVLYLSLNPYERDQYVLVLDNGDIHFKVAESLQEDVARALTKVEELNGGFASRSRPVPAPYNPAAESHSSAVTQRKSSSWWKKVGSNLLGAAAQTVATAAMGALCIVM